MHQTLARPGDLTSRHTMLRRVLGLVAAAALTISLGVSAVPAIAQPTDAYYDCEHGWTSEFCNEEEPEQAPEQVNPAEYPKPGTVTAGMSILPEAAGWIKAWSSEIEWLLNGVEQPVQRAEDEEFGTDIVGGSRFVVPVSAIGKRLVVRVHMDDVLGKSWVDEFDLGYVKANVFTKAPAPTFSGTTTAGNKLTASAGSWAPKASIAYQWYRNGTPVPGATKQTYTLVAADAGRQIKVRTRATATGVTTVEKFSVERSIAAARFTSAPTPTITGTARVGNSLKVSTRKWAPPPTFGYQWYRNNAVIKGATKSSHTTTAADLNKSLKVRVTAKRSGHPTTTRVSAARKITAGILKTGSKLTVSGTARSGSTISASVKAPAASKSTYQWYKNGKKISKATTKSYKLSSKDVGAKYQVRMSFTRAGYSKLNVNSNSVKIAKPAFSVMFNPKVSGTKKAGSTLKATTGSYSPKPTSHSYQWLRNGKPISKATRSTFKLTASDNGKKISVKVTAKKKNYQSKSATSGAVSIPVPVKTVMSDNGTYRVGKDVNPGLYKATGNGKGCYWARTSGFSGSFKQIKANYFGTANTYVRIVSGDKGFTTSGCGKWTTVNSSGAKASKITKDGTYRVGIDIKPGRYIGKGSSSCYWATYSDFTGDFKNLITNDFTAGRLVIDVPATAKGFEVSGCGTLTH
ncbi:hypothetical protein [Paeniglutamicibacter gangotriensis]|uniref:Ig-like domain-containing protein n=1 Tax=Paeniglutamicibacter gangotriensis Lz1y TaxID=1276920 RepID=M7MY30_9MICC|nr:hypothetical protein [Paeniglutamicibacter gangotriensis]EMQ99855.1 hypothetical protein ADIAG_00958 [Paeniglutamicibacter gangotriensis Lz1y]